MTLRRMPTSLPPTVTTCILLTVFSLLILDIDTFITYLFLSLFTPSANMRRAFYFAVKFYLQTSPARI